MKYEIIAICGSLRKESFTHELLKAFHKSAPTEVNFQIIDISDLPFFNEDLEQNPPDSVKKLFLAIEAADAVLLASPEYNRSYSPVIKNAIDWGSRPEGENKWDGKPAGIIGCSPYRHGAFGAVNHLRQVLMYVNMYAMQQPEFYLEEIGSALDGNGQVNNRKTQQYIADYWIAFVEWIKRLESPGN